MSVINDLGPVQFRKEFSYAKTCPTFASTNTGGLDEIARWALDINDLLYQDEPHAPHLCTSIINKLTGQTGSGNSPALVMTDALIYTTDSIVQFLDQRCAPAKRLIPRDAAAKNEVIALYKLFTGALEDNVSKYIYSQLLPAGNFAKALYTQRIPENEKFMFRMGYSSTRSALTKELGLDAKTKQERLAAIQQVFTQVGDLLADGRKYLAAGKLTIADIAFAAVAAPFVIPEEYGGVIARINGMPEELRQVVIAMRATPAGQFILRLYREDRPAMRSQKEIVKESEEAVAIEQRIGIFLTGRQPNLFYFLQKRFPVLRVGRTKLMTVNRSDLVAEMFERHQDFTIEEINAKRMAAQKGTFFLGMDTMNPQFDLERNFVRRSAHKEDLDLVRSFVKTATDEIIQRAQPYGKIDVASSLCYVVLTRMIDQYFGVPGPTEAKMQEWLRALFYELFLNFTNDKAKDAAAMTAAVERRDWILELIKNRKQDLKGGKQLDDNILNRMILMQQQPGNEWFDDDTIHRNMGGLITGILETTNKAVILVLDELFTRPDVLKGAIETAQKNDMKKMYGYVSEALRFNPAQPGVIRYSENKQVLKGKGSKLYTIPAKSTIFVLTSAAMFDPAAFPDPKTFNPERDSVYMNWGSGLHECYGKYINAVTISEFVAAILRLKNVRREPGAAGRNTGLVIETFMNNFVVRFDA